MKTKLILNLVYRIAQKFIYASLLLAKIFHFDWLHVLFKKKF